MQLEDLGYEKISDYKKRANFAKRENDLDVHIVLYKDTKNVEKTEMDNEFRGKTVPLTFDEISAVAEFLNKNNL